MSDREIMKVNDYSKSGAALVKVERNNYLPMHLRVSPAQAQTLTVLRKWGFSPKVFCLAHSNASSTFEVESDKWKWQITPVDKSNVATIPEPFLEATLHLLRNRFPISELALAKPKPVDSTTDIVIDELHKQVVAAVKTCMFCVELLVAILISLNSSSENTANANTAPKAVAAGNIRKVQPPDPVLLAKVEDKWIEIGRWE